ncbi:hypothetical protein [uncultured Marixanthomonas sp.]|uniref:hypothetical protein n=1 Tax=uncultured Marixanthomonas sp. TaxID=757245 RepID=UPI0030DA870A|tara:strand:+ start:276900 stop:277367 length:468 start_codon:yes stop_codon:yes gene_type:complete
MNPDQLKHIDKMVADMLAGYSSIQAFYFYLEKLRSETNGQFSENAPIHLKMYNKATHIASVEITKRFKEGTLKRVPKEDCSLNLKNLKNNSIFKKEKINLKGIKEYYANIYGKTQSHPKVISKIIQESNITSSSKNTQFYNMLAIIKEEYIQEHK